MNTCCAVILDPSDVILLFQLPLRSYIFCKLLLLQWFHLVRLRSFIRARPHAYIRHTRYLHPLSYLQTPATVVSFPLYTQLGYLSNTTSNPNPNPPIDRRRPFNIGQSRESSFSYVNVYITLISDITAQHH